MKKLINNAIVLWQRDRCRLDIRCLSIPFVPSCVPPGLSEYGTDTPASVYKHFFSGGLSLVMAVASTSPTSFSFSSTVPPTLWIWQGLRFDSPWRFPQVLSVRRSNELHDHRSCISHTIFTSGCLATGICFSFAPTSCFADQFHVDFTMT